MAQNYNTMSYIVATSTVCVYRYEFICELNNIGHMKGNQFCLLATLWNLRIQCERVILT